MSTYPLFTDQVLPARQKEPIEFYYTLSTFVAKDNVFPIFYEETIDGSVFNRISFCFYYDTTKKQFRVFKYVFDRATAKGVKAAELEKASFIVRNGKDFQKLLHVEENWFIRDHLAAMYQLFGDNPIAETMRSLSNILDRMIHRGTSAENMYVDIISHCAPSRADSMMRYYDTRNGKKFNMPINVKAVISPYVTNVLGKQPIFRDIQIPSCKVELHKDKVVGFENINFIFSANSLLKQYKVQHKVVDTVKALFGK